jgi:hypothetical protein
VGILVHDHSLPCIVLVYCRGNAILSVPFSFFLIAPSSFSWPSLLLSDSVLTSYTSSYPPRPHSSFRTDLRRRPFSFPLSNSYSCSRWYEIYASRSPSRSLELASNFARILSYTHSTEAVHLSQRVASSANFPYFPRSKKKMWMYEPLSRVVQASCASDGCERLQTRELHVYATCQFISVRIRPFPRHTSTGAACGLDPLKPAYINRRITSPPSRDLEFASIRCPYQESSAPNLPSSRRHSSIGSQRSRS